MMFRKLDFSLLDFVLNKSVMLVNMNDLVSMMVMWVNKKDLLVNRRAMLNLVLHHYQNMLDLLRHTMDLLDYNEEISNHRNHLMNILAKLENMMVNSVNTRVM